MKMQMTVVIEAADEMELDDFADWLEQHAWDHPYNVHVLDVAVSAHGLKKKKDS